MPSNTFFQDKHYWIIGASDGIGAALAQELSARGATLTLSARRMDALNNVAERCSGEIHTRVLDLSDRDALVHCISAIATDHGQLDGALNIAAIYDPGLTSEMDLDAAIDLVDVNLIGSLAFANLVPSILRPGAQLVFFGSVAGYFGLPGGQPYSATKAAVANLAESVHGELAPEIDVRLVSPGFVRTRLTEKNDFEMPGLIEPDEAAREIADGLVGHRFEIHFPKSFTRRVKLLRTMPYAWAFRVLSQITPKKE